VTEKSDEPTLITAMPVHGRHSRPDFAAKKIALEEYERGWDAREKGAPFDEDASRSWQQGWNCRDVQPT
jgi:hypothetical protein